MMHGVGIREVVALGVLGVAAFLGFLFFDPTSTESTPDSTRTVQPEGGRPAEGLGEWTVTLYEGAPESARVILVRTEAALDLSYQGSPVPDIRDDAWGISARAEFDGEADRYLLEIEWSGELSLMIDGEETAVTPGTGPRRIRVPVQHDGEGATAIVIRVQDTGGPAAVRAVLTH